MKIESKLVTVAELALMLGLHRETIRRLAKTGKLPAYRIAGGPLRFDLVEVESDLRIRHLVTDRPV